LFYSGLGPGSYTDDLYSTGAGNYSGPKSRSLITSKTTSFGGDNRFKDESKQKNFRIGPKTMGPGPTSY
jgi:hypothetical protein